MEQMNTMPQEGGSKKSNWLIWVIVIAIVAVVIYLLMQSGTSSPSTGGTPRSEDTAALINKDINNIQLNDVDGDFKSIDADLSTL